MALQAEPVNFLPSQLITNSIQSGYALPEANQAILFDPFTATMTIDADAGVANNIPFSRKRSRDEANYDYDFTDQDIMCQLQLQQQSYINFIIAQHDEKLKVIIRAIHHAFSKKLEEKDEQIKSLLNLNIALHDKEKRLNTENQAWKNFALINEEAVISLQKNLEQVLAQAANNQCVNGDVYLDDAKSSCGSTNDVDKRTLCRQCKVRESTVLLLSCKHMCLCTMCGSSVHTCPVCNSFSETSVHVNMC